MNAQSSSEMKIFISDTSFNPKDAKPTVSILIGRHLLNIAIGLPFLCKNPC